jgi:hypothetical protein
MKGWVDRFFQDVVAVPNVYGKNLAAMYIVYAYSVFSRIGMNPSSVWVSFWDMFMHGYFPPISGADYGPWGRQHSYQPLVPWRPTAPSIFHSTVEDLVKQWESSPPSNLIAVGTDYRSGDDTSDFERGILAGWSDFPKVGPATYALWQSEADAVHDLLQPPTLGGAEYFFCLHLLAGIATGNTAAHALASRVVDAPASTTEYPNDTFINQLIYATLLYLADPMGAFGWNNAALQSFFGSLAGVLTSPDPVSAAIKTSIDKHLKMLAVDSAYPMQDPYAPSVGFNQRQTDTLFALDQARAALRS